MYSVNFIAQKDEATADLAFVYRCDQPKCKNKKILAVDIDKHALGHKAGIMRTFISEGAYQDFVHENAVKASIGE